MIELCIFYICKGCQIYGFGASVAALAEIWSLAAVSYDRFQSMYHLAASGKRMNKSQVQL